MPDQLEMQHRGVQERQRFNTDRKAEFRLRIFPRKNQNSLWLRRVGMRAFSAMAVLLLMACAAEEAAVPVSAAPAPAVPPIYTPTAIAPRLLPGTPAPTPAMQAQQNLERAMRVDDRPSRPSRMDPGQGQLTPDSGPLQTDVGIDAQYPDQPSNAAPIFQRR